MRKILILFAHPRFEHSTVNLSLVKTAQKLPFVTFHDLYEHYPDFNINIKHEQELLLKHDVIVWHHPFYWYSCPPLLKQWIDLVLEFNWAYGPNGSALAGKYVVNAISTGGTREAYQEGGRNRYTLKQMLTPFDQTATLCKMKYIPPFAVQGTHRLGQSELHSMSLVYEQFLKFLSDENNIPEEFKHLELFNDYFIKPQ
jgi:glutathione-regulated potassium-efflux system ancillary protein KefG